MVAKRAAEGKAIPAAVTIACQEKWNGVGTELVKDMVVL